MGQLGLAPTRKGGLIGARKQEHRVSTAALTAPEQRGRPFQPGQSGNPAGRPPGSENKLAEAFLRELASDFEEHGAAAIARVREEDPTTYLKLVAVLVAKQAVAPEPMNMPRPVVLQDFGTPDEQEAKMLEQQRRLIAEAQGQ